MLRGKFILEVILINSLLQALNARAQGIGLGFRVLSHEGELIAETEFPFLQAHTDLKSACHKGFSSLQIHADWDPVHKIFKFIAGKPWSWCYHIYDATKSQEEYDIKWQDRFYKLNRQKSLAGYDQTLSSEELIEWLPCLDFKIDFH